jgi:protein disulfide-isomerase A1
MTTIAIGLVVACCVLPRAASNVDAEDNVIVLGASNFESYIEKTPLVLVDFYAPWCGHCKQLAPEYAAAAKILQAEGVPLAKVDAADEQNQKLAEQYDVQGFPTLKLFKRKKASDYIGERTTDAIVAFMRKKAGPPTTDLASDTMATEFKDSANVSVIGFFTDKNSEAFKAYETAAGEVDDVVFGTVHDNGIRALFRAEKESIILYKKFDDKRVVYDGEMQPNPIAEFAKSNAMPLVVPFNEANAPKIFGGTIKVHLIVFLDPDKETELMAKLAAPAAKFKGQVMVITVSPAEEQIIEYFGITTADMPAVRLVDMRDIAMKKYVYDQPALDEASIQNFIDEFLAGNLKATLKTEEAPLEDEGPVKVVVSKTFKAEVVENENDVLVEFYAPWCGHCKELAPRYHALATKLQHAKKLVIAKVNAEANEIDGVIVEGFPTLRLYPAAKKFEPVDYTGERTAEAIEEWLVKEVTHKWESPPNDPVEPTERKQHEGSEL